MPETDFVRSICLAAIVSDEDAFIDEWLIYHLSLGIEHFYLYDDDPRQHLKEFLSPHHAYVTVIPWFEKSYELPGINRQTKAFLDAVKNYSRGYEWFTFLDIDEFIVLRRHENIQQFLVEFAGWGAVSLNWHVFGHNGYFDDPPDLVTASLTRRKSEASKRVKTITRSEVIENITTAHFCQLKENWLRADANKHIFSKLVYPGKTDVAHINHYQCRSFSRWMKRAYRGDVSIDNNHTVQQENEWKMSEIGCLKQFVTTVAKDKNEYADNFMLKYSDFLRAKIKNLRPSWFEDKAS